jgi:hypothetical protein
MIKQQVISQIISQIIAELNRATDKINEMGEFFRDNREEESANLMEDAKNHLMQVATNLVTVSATATTGQNHVSNHRSEPHMERIHMTPITPEQIRDITSTIADIAVQISRMEQVCTYTGKTRLADRFQLARHHLVRGFTDIIAVSNMLSDEMVESDPLPGDQR